MAVKEFEWVYIYKNNKTNEIDYIGRARNAYRCALRIYDHTRDKWHTHFDYTIFFEPALNRAESEAVETELINTYKPNYNKDKVEWGHFRGVAVGALEDMLKFKEEQIDSTRLPSVLKWYEIEIKKRLVNNGKSEICNIQ